MDSELRKLREERKLSQAQVAKAIDVSKTTLSRWERGQFKTIEPRKFSRLAMFFDVSIDRILPMQLLAFFLTPMEREIIAIVRAHPELQRVMVGVLKTIAVGGGEIGPGADQGAKLTGTNG